MGRGVPLRRTESTIPSAPRAVRSAITWRAIPSRPTPDGSTTDKGLTAASSARIHMIRIQPATPTAGMVRGFRQTPTTILTAQAVPIATIAPPTPMTAACESKGSKELRLEHKHSEALDLLLRLAFPFESHAMRPFVGLDVLTTSVGISSRIERGPFRTAMRRPSCHDLLGVWRANAVREI